MLTPYIGAWSLDPAASDYGDQPVPQRALYTILPIDGGAWFHVDWTDAAGERRAVQFATPFGAPREHGHLVVRGALGPSGLVTEATRGDELLLRAVRTLGPDGTLHVAQTDADGTSHGVYRRTKVKQVICYRRDLKMRKGKIAAQCAHASLGVFTRRHEGPPGTLSVALDGAMALWVHRGSAKIVLSVETEADLLTVAEAARARGLPHALITDAGRTEFGGVPTRTAIALGPAAAADIDAITGPEGLVTTKLA